MKNVPSLRLNILSILGITLSVPVSAYSETISLYGDNGITGTQGVSGEPGTSGESGTSGTSVAVTANVIADSDNRADVRGGTGGRGGSGGSGLNGTLGGDGGDLPRECLYNSNKALVRMQTTNRFVCTAQF